MKFTNSFITDHTDNSFFTQFTHTFLLATSGENSTWSLHVINVYYCQLFIWHKFRYWNYL